jgi:hypothetical protein
MKYKVPSYIILLQIIYIYIMLYEAMKIIINALNKNFNLSNIQEIMH